MTRLPLQVLVHGGGGTGAEMEPLAEALRPFADVRLPTLAGHGGLPIPERFTIREFAADLIAYFDREGIERAFVTGYSFGAYVVLYLARHFPHRLHGACSLAGKFVFDARTVSHWNHIASEERLTRGGSLEGAAMAMAHLPQNWLVIARRFRDLFAEMGEKPALSDADLASISIPVMLVSADRDPIVPWEETQALGALIPGARIMKLAGSAHPLSGMPLHAVARSISQWMHDVEDG